MGNSNVAQEAFHLELLSLVTEGPQVFGLPCFFVN
jgi:hypothetical protein